MKGSTAKELLGVLQDVLSSNTELQASIGDAWLQRLSNNPDYEGQLCWAAGKLEQMGIVRVDTDSVPVRSA